MTTKAQAGFAADAPWIRPYYPIIRAVAADTGVPAAVIAGQISRESGGGRLLTPQGPAGFGYGGEVGLMQIHPKWHEFAKSGNWQDPQASISYGASLVAMWAQKYGGLPVGLAYYNTGASAVTDFKAGRDPDLTTSGGDYGKDIMNRAALFETDLGAVAGGGGLGDLLKKVPWWLWGILGAAVLMDKGEGGEHGQR